MSAGKILFVVHGKGRGRPSPTGQAFLERMKASNPELAKKVWVHKTGDPMPSLQGCSLIVFWLGDPLKVKYPSCFDEAIIIANAAAKLGIPVLNHPDALNHTAKSTQSELWRQASIPSAKSELVFDGAGLERAVQRFGTPTIFRPDAEHAQRGMILINSVPDLLQLDMAERLPGVVLQVTDVRQAYRDAGVSPKSPFFRFHHKARAFVFRDQVKPSHIVFSESMIVGVANCTFQRQGNRLSGVQTTLYRMRNDVAAHIREDLRYFNSDALGAQVLIDAARALGLDFAAIDYSIFPDGQLILWEANPYFYLPVGTESVMSIERSAVSRVNETFDWMGRCLQDIAVQNENVAARRIVG